MKTIRTGKGKGLGSGYKNIMMAHDKRVHRDAGLGRRQPQKIIRFNTNNLTSIKKAEKLKSRLENKGFNLKSTKQIGFDDWEIKYEKGGKNTFMTAYPSPETEIKGSLRASKPQMSEEMIDYITKDWMKPEHTKERYEFLRRIRKGGKDRSWAWIDAYEKARKTHDVKTSEDIATTETKRKYKKGGKAPKDLPKELKGLWDAQYENKQKDIEGITGKNSKAYKKYMRLPFSKKISVIDRMHQKGILGGKLSKWKLDFKLKSGTRQYISEGDFYYQKLGIWKSPTDNKWVVGKDTFKKTPTGSENINYLFIGKFNTLMDAKKQAKKFMRTKL